MPRTIRKLQYIAMDILNPLNKAIKYPQIPNLVFTLPRIAQVGVSLKEAKAHPELYRVASTLIPLFLQSQQE